MIVSGNIESLPNSAPGDMGWLMDTYTEMVDMLYTFFCGPIIGKDIGKSSSIFFPIASV